MNFSQIKNWIFIPDYYDPELRQEISNLNNTDKFDVKTIGNLVENKELQIKRGNEIGSQFYGREKSHLFAQVTL